MFDAALRRIDFFFRFVIAEFFAWRSSRFANRIKNRLFRFFLFLTAHTIKPYNRFLNLTSKDKLFVDNLGRKINR